MPIREQRIDIKSPEDLFDVPDRIHKSMQSWPEDKFWAIYSQTLTAHALCLAEAVKAFSLKEKEKINTEDLFHMVFVLSGDKMASEYDLLKIHHYVFIDLFVEELKSFLADAL